MARPRGNLAVLPLILAAFGGCGRAAPPPADQTSSSAGPSTLAAEAAVRAALSRPVSLSVRGDALADVLPRLTEQAGLRLTILPTAEAAHADSGPRIYAEWQNLPLDVALRTLLEPLDLVFTVDAGGVTVRSRFDPAGPPTTIVYPILDLVGRDGGRFQEADYRDIVAAVVHDCGQAGRGFLQETPGALVVTQSEQVHAEIARVLAEIRRMTDAPPHDPPPSPVVEAPPDSPLARQLRRPVTIAWQGLWPAKLAARLTDEFGITVILASDTLGIDIRQHGDQFIDLHAWDQPLSGPLHGALQNAYLDWRQAGEALVIDGRDEVYADERTFVRVYSNPDPADWQGLRPSADVADFIFGFVAPHMWEGSGGPYILRDVPGGFVAQQTEEGHAEIASLLARLRMLNDPLLESFADPAAAAERRIDELLDQTVDVDWQKGTLREALKELLAQHGIQPIAFDGAAIDEAGARVDDPCTLALSGLTLRQVLRRVLGERGLTWIIEDGLLVITSDDVADSSFSTWLYRLPGTLQAHMPGSADAVLEMLQSIVQAQSWVEMGGPGSMEAVPGGIAVQQTYEAHKELAAALASIGRLGQADLPDEPLGGHLPADVALEKRLAATIDFAAVGEPLEVAVRRLLRQAGLEDRLHLGPDWPDDSQFAFPFEPVIFRARQVSVAAALRLLLVPHDATFVVRQGMIVPLSREAAENESFDWCYHLPDRLNGDALSNSDVAALLRCVQPESWDRRGGSGAIHRVPGGIVVWQTSEIQAEIQRLLAQLRPLLADPAAPLPARPQTAAERRVEAALASPLTCRIAEAPLDLVLETLALRTGIDLFIDPDHGVTLRRLAEPLVGFSAEEEPFARLADRLLSPRALGWTVRHDVLYVADAAAIGREQRLYDARHLLRPRGELTEEELLSLVDGAMHADESAASTLHGGLLLAAHTRRWHAELQDLLAPGNEVLPRIHALHKAATGGRGALPAADHAVALRSALDDPSAAVRRFALRSLLARAPEVAADSPELLRALADDDPLVRLAGVLALGKSPPQPEALAPLMALLDDRDVEVRLEAIAELGRMGTNARAAAPSLGRLLRDRDPIQRQALLESLTALGEAAEEAALQLAPLARQPDFTVAAIAAWESMGSAAVPEILLLLESRRDCFDPCCDALARLGPQAAAAAPRLAALLPAFESFRRERLCEVLGALGAEGALAVPALVAYLNDDRLTIRTAACRALRDIAADPETAVPALRQALAFALNESDGVEMRIAACQALAAFGPQAAAAEPELRRAQSDDHPGVQAAAREALTKIGVAP